MIINIRLQTSDFRHQQVHDLLGAAGDFILVVHEIGTDEHQGRELRAVVIVVLEDNIGILIEET